jgi:hypothetical protein
MVCSKFRSVLSKADRLWKELAPQLGDSAQQNDETTALMQFNEDTPIVKRLFFMKHCYQIVRYSSKMQFLLKLLHSLKREG